MGVLTRELSDVFQRRNVPEQLLGLLLAKVRQPRVIAEVIGGIILGPTVMGRIPGFTAHIFPDISIPLLTLTSTIGLVFFLFLVGLEIDVRLLKKNAKYSLTISAVGMILPFGMGVGLAVPLYNRFVSDTINFGHFLLFVGVAVAITAFPVLCRILTDLNLLEDHVGVVVLSAGVGNDVVGWILLALAVALTNASSGIAALWILLTGLAFVFPVGLLMAGKTLRISGNRSTDPFDDDHHPPSDSDLGLLHGCHRLEFLLIVSLPYPDFELLIGIHPIFGGFIAGLIIPHEGGFAIALVEKLEDLICLIFIPLYFTLSGLRTNLGLLNDGITWGYVVFICVVAFSGKFLGCAVTAKLMGFTKRESTAIGTLMSCKGLVELIVLNVGVSAGILNTRVFSMFVVHALVLTVLTTPLTLWCYSPQHRTGKSGLTLKDEEKEISSDMSETFKHKFSIILNNMEHLPAVMTIMQLLQNVNNFGANLSTNDIKSDTSHDLKENPDRSPTILSRKPITVDALRLLELTDRTSAVMRSSETDEIMHRDPLLSVFKTFGRLLNLSVSSTLSVVSQETQPYSVATHLRSKGSQMVIIPWQAGSTTVMEGGSPAYNPFEGIFNRVASSDRTPSSISHENFVRKLFSESPADVALFVDRNGVNAGHQHLFLPFFGGPDDRLALHFVVQLCSNSNISATVIRVRRAASGDSKSEDKKKDNLSVTLARVIFLFTIPIALFIYLFKAPAFPDTIYASQNTQTRIASDIADDLLWFQYTRSDSSAGSSLSPDIKLALSRVTFTENSSSTPLRSVIHHARNLIPGSAAANRSLILVSGRGRRLGLDNHQVELETLLSESSRSTSMPPDVTKTVGEVAAGFMVALPTVSGIMVLQAAGSSNSLA
ncbi:hypothetical protein Clacol_001345 [Clathrus columnatus]|uniref:Cation/H+ exchanger transmembrane domain-containing protein n=1 Tax=Clathrus columnatus TaxID=1419009 RepID=A0AAV5A2B5_9AGAM|nr:hypothetical protein Clacol_001345 [Clathrus columnatus]